MCPFLYRSIDHRLRRVFSHPFVLILISEHAKLVSDPAHPVKRGQYTTVVLVSAACIADQGSDRHISYPQDAKLVMVPAI